MESNEKTKELVLKYFQSWQTPSDFEEMRSYLASGVLFDMNGYQLQGTEAVMGMVMQDPTPWKEVELLDCQFSPTQAAIIYQGINTATDQKIRVAEHLHLANDKITRATVVMSVLPN